MNTWLRRIAIGLAAVLAVSAIFKEFAQPRGLRVGEGRVFGVPYNFRLPTGRDLRRRYWNAEGDLIAPPLIGVGIYPNLPAIWRKVRGGS